jgi:acetyl-CoA acyltransferase 1
MKYPRRIPIFEPSDYLRFLHMSSSEMKIRIDDNTSLSHRSNTTHTLTHSFRTLFLRKTAPHFHFHSSTATSPPKLLQINMSSQRVNSLIAHLSAPASSTSSHLNGNVTAASFSGPIGSKGEDDVVIIAANRTPIGRARKGSFKDLTPDDLLTAAIAGTVKRAGIDGKILGDIVVGNVQTEGAYAGPARMAQFRAGIPYDVPLVTINRQCSSGLQAVANIASAIKAGVIDSGIGAGVESMTHGGAPGAGSMPPANFTEIFENDMAKQCLTPMGETAENVAERYGVTREMQDAMGVASHAKALAAQANGSFNDEIIPVAITNADGDEVMHATDDGPRKGTTMEGLGKLKTVFKADGSVTAGTSSQVSDGAAAVVLMRRSKATELGLKPIGVMRGYKVTGCQPDEMGVGPAVAIPAVLEQCNLKIDDIDIYEVNEAFAAQAVYCVKKLGIPEAKLNPLGGAIALGHPLGCTGARQIATLLHQLRRTGQKTGIVSMCIGTGMGAAAVFEAE